MTRLLTTWEKDPTSVPVGPLGIIAMAGCEEIGEKINQWLLKWHSLQELQDEEYYTSPGLNRDTFLVKAYCPRFGTGEGKAVLRESVRGMDLYILVDVCAHNVHYNMYGQEVPMSPDDHFQDLKRVIGAIGGKAKRVTVVMPMLYESRQHRRTSRESLDCAMGLQELVNMGIRDIITFDAHDPRMVNAVPLIGFENVMPNYQMLKALLREDYLKVFANSLQLAFFTTVISLLVGYPFGYCMARAPRKWKALLMMLVIIPFWTSALVRIYGWKILLQANGPVNGVLRSLGLIQKNIKFLGSYGSVLLAMVYCLISFMILPCHNAVDKMDFTLVEASRDLGASPVRAFLTVTLPLTMPGILAGCVLVFVPSVGLFYLSDIMGGGLVLVGNLIRDQLLKVRDWNVGSAMSMVLIALSAGIYLLYRKVGGDDLGVM